ncbi:hypothetical protein KMW28_01115 [Flammeovirga yaeyamensis]|uniref:Phosphate-selective porin O and P n=1 Tax=Flammeovirga yaeyamensis TaxID=367791 RepID=A0AAX1N862_9BACT|nr:hypothetical protein [Flammeovirga yaeyamensis]MBB3699683.1 hypothetical protein [Flammeovirga yaeyamensis]NMF36747.1 hypothetical protein [Flammeovirga yaeyamensis]QWG02212.1 hypothetical protein KMW28_01115 [Flammeovirga yaeyamensis]
MNNQYKVLSVFAVLFFMAMSTSYAQKNSGVFDRDMQYMRYNDQRGIGVFETTKSDTVGFDGMKVRVGADFALQMQGLSHSNSGVVELAKIHPGFNLPTANLNIDAQLADGVRVHLQTYLSSRHHNDAWVMGGYLQIDNLNFLNLNSQMADDIMDIITVKVGQMEINYGDQHFRRINNAYSMGNAFFGNTIMDPFATEMAMEVYAQKDGWIGMAGVSNGKLNQNVTSTGNWSVYGKFGFDKQVNEDLRARLTGSVYHNSNLANANLYAGDRAGSRFYSVMDVPGHSTTASYKNGRVDPGFNGQITSFMINPFVKFKGLEFFGTYEVSNGSGKNEFNENGDIESRNWNQINAELIYRFGNTEQFYVGGKYNTAWGTNRNEGGEYFDAEGNGVGEFWSVENANLRQNRLEVAAGWFMTRNVMMKAGYVHHTYSGYDVYADTHRAAPEGAIGGSTNAIYEDGKFNGFMLEAAISF